MKLLGAMLLLAASMLCGCMMAAKLRERVQLLQRLIRLTDAIITELQHNLPFIADLLPQLAAMPAFRSLHFLQIAAARADSFPESWQEAVNTDVALPQDVREVLVTVGQTLGSTTLEGQVSALRLCQQQLITLRERAEELSRRKGGLFRSMGLLCGMFLVILLL
ncbi:MAG: stage III sporulation protein AB [Oscillospiraceae bacterium]|nr:stage III sporulation protein AB [Oscillospiraceae bacterium]